MMNLRLRRVRGLSLIFVVLALALAAACGDDDDEAPAAAAATAAAQGEVAAATAAAESAEAEAAAARAEAEAAQAAVAEAETEAEAAVARATAAEAETRAAAAEARAAEERATVAEAVQKTGVLKLGLIGSLSGFAVLWGVPTHDAVHMAVNEVNRGECEVCEPGGGFMVGDTLYTFEIYERDIRSEQDLAVPAAIELVRDVGVKYVIGPMLDDYSVLTQEYTNEEGVIMFSGSTVHQTYLTPESVAPGGDKRFLFKVHPTDIVRDVILAQGVSDFVPEAKTSVLLIRDDPVGDSVPPFWTWAEREVGREPIAILKYPPGTTDFAPIMTRLKAIGADVAFLWYLAQDMYEQIRIGAEIDAAPAYFLMAIDPVDFWEAFPDGYDSKAVLACMMACWDSGLPSVQEYWDRFRASGGTFSAIVGHALMTGPYVKVLAEAMVNTGTVDDTEVLVDYIEDIRYDGPYGEIYFDNRHIVEHGFELCFAGGVGKTEADMECRWYEQFTGLPAVLPEIELP